MKFQDYIIEHDSVISDELCAQIIDRFENDERAKPGIVGDGVVITDLKKSTDLLLSKFSDWGDIDTLLYESLTEHVQEYLEFLRESGISISRNSVDDSGYQIQRSGIGGKYGWHSDDYATIVIPDNIDLRNCPPKSLLKVENQRRVATYIFYLNDYEEDFDGGRTLFRFGDEIIEVKPKRGKLLLFPSTQTFVHCGEVVTRGNKYIVTGWVRDYHYDNLYVK